MSHVQDPPETFGCEEETIALNSVATLSSPWQFDDLAPTCHGCNVDFNAFCRKHHCRLCGNIFCGNCSNQRALIPPTSIVLVPKGGRKARHRNNLANISFTPDEDPDRMLTYISSGNDKQLLYGKGLEERFHLAREPLRVCKPCFAQVQALQSDLRASNSNAVRFNVHDAAFDNSLAINSPIAFTLGHEVRKAARTLNNLLPRMPRNVGALMEPSRMMQSTTGSTFQEKEHANDQSCLNSNIPLNLTNLDGVRIPARLVEQAKGVAVLTVVKGGFGLAGAEFGTGLVVARIGDNRWSAPSAIGLGGLSWGALLGAQVSDHVFLLMNNESVELLFEDGSVQMGADVGIAVGPLGRSVEADFGASPGKVASIYTYSMSKGLYAGVSLDGKVIVTRDRVNEKFYGRTITGREILRGDVPSPPAAQPLYEALTRCHVYASGGNRPTSHPHNQQPLSTPTLTDPVMSEYGEIQENDADVPMPSTLGNDRSLAGLIDILNSG
jgi:lipid-binding SYLF domain-containing protein